MLNDENDNMILSAYSVSPTIQALFHLVVQQPPPSSENLLVILMLVSSPSSLPSSSDPLFVYDQQPMGEVIPHEQSVKDWRLASVLILPEQNEHCDFVEGSEAPYPKARDTSKKPLRFPILFKEIDLLNLNKHFHAQLC